MKIISLQPNIYLFNPLKNPLKEKLREKDLFHFENHDNK